MTINLKTLEGFKKEEQLVFILAHLKDISWAYPKEMEKLAEKFPVIKDMPTNHNLLYAEIYEAIFNQQSFAEDNDTHYKREITKIGDAINRLASACYKEKAKMIAADRSIVDLGRELAKHDREAARDAEAHPEDTSDNVKGTDPSQEGEHASRKRRRKANVKKEKPKTKAKGKSNTKRPKDADVKAEPPMNRPFVMIPKRFHANPDG
jgi:hypothetical protein